MIPKGLGTEPIELPVGGEGDNDVFGSSEVVVCKGHPGRGEFGVPPEIVDQPSLLLPLHH